MARIILETAGEDVFVGGDDIEVFGTTEGGEVITVNAGSNVVFDGSFAAGGDEIELPGGAGSYSATISGSRVILTSTNGTTVSIPLGEAGIDIDFGGGDVRTLQIVDGEVVLGEQTIEPGATPTELDAGASNLQFTTEADTLVGSESDDVFDAGLDVALGGLVGVQTLQGADEADGGAGLDVLNAELNSTGTTANPTLEGIEVYNLTSFGTVSGDDFGTSTLNLARATGYEQLWNIDSTGNLTLTNVGEVAVLGLDGVQAGSTYTVNYDGLAVEEQTIVGLGNGFPPAGDVFEDSVYIQINGVDGNIGTLNLDVTGGNLFYLENEAATAENLDIDGDGELGLVADDNFAELETLDATGYNGDPLVLDISGSDEIVSIETGDGDDNLTVAAVAFSADTDATAVDLGAGMNTLTLIDSIDSDDTLDADDDTDFDGDGVLESDEMSSLDFSAGTVANVQVLNLQNVTLLEDTTLALDGVGGLETLELDDFYNDGDDLTVSGGPETLTVEATGSDFASLDMNGGVLTVNDTADLTLLSGEEGDVDAELAGDSLINVDVVAGDNAYIDMNEAPVLVDLDVTAVDDAVVSLTDNDGDDADGAGLESLEDVTVISEDGNATLQMIGAAGMAAQIATFESYTFAVTDVAIGESGSVVFASDSLNGGSEVASFDDVDTAVDGNIGAAAAIAAELNLSGQPITASAIGNEVTITATTPGEFDDLSAIEVGDFTVTQTGFTDGQDAAAATPGSGFSSLENANVIAAIDANVYLQDVYGDFDLQAVGGDDAFVLLYNTAVNSVNVTASLQAPTVEDPDGGYAQVVIYGDTYGAASLEAVSVTAADSFVYLDDDMSVLDTVDLTGSTTQLYLYGEFGTLSTVDLTGISDDADVYAFAGEFTQGAGESVNYLIGSTDEVFVYMNEGAREIATFTTGDFGTVILGSDLDNGEFEVQDEMDTDPSDRIDLSALGFTGAAQLNFEINSDGDLVITDLEGGPGDFDGEIIIDIEGDFNADMVDDFASNNIIFA